MASSVDKRAHHAPAVIYSPVAPKHEPAATVIPSGKGEALNTFPGVKKLLHDRAADDDAVVLLHSLLFGHKGKAANRKKDLRAFHGFGHPIKEGKKALETVVANKKYTHAVLHDLCAAFELPVAKRTRQELAEALMHVLAKPTAHAAEVARSAPEKKHKTASAGSASEDAEKTSAGSKRKGAAGGSGGSSKPPKKAKSKAHAAPAAEEGEEMLEGKVTLLPLYAGVSPPAGASPGVTQVILPAAGVAQSSSSSSSPPAFAFTSIATKSSVQVFEEGSAPAASSSAAGVNEEDADI